MFQSPPTRYQCHHGHGFPLWGGLWLATRNWLVWNKKVPPFFLATKNFGMYINLMKSQWNPSFWCSKNPAFFHQVSSEAEAGWTLPNAQPKAGFGGWTLRNCSYEGDPFFQKWICWYQMVVFFMCVWKWGIKKKHVSEDNDDHLLEWGMPLFSDKPMFIHTLRETGRSGSGEKNI